MAYRNTQFNTKQLEDPIDIMVYKLGVYPAKGGSLTYEEVKIVDPAFALTREEYEGYSLDASAGKPEFELTEKEYENYTTP